MFIGEQYVLWSIDEVEPDGFNRQRKSSQYVNIFSHLNVILWSFAVIPIEKTVKTVYVIKSVWRNIALKLLGNKFSLLVFQDWLYKCHPLWKLNYKIKLNTSS